MQKGVLSQRTKKIRTHPHFRLPKTLKLARKPKYVRTSIPHMPRMDQYAVLRHPLCTEDAIQKIEKENTIVFIVDVKASKGLIKEAVKRMYDVDALKINTLIRYVL